MLEPKIRLAVLFGGRSGEHDVSCGSAAGILTSLDRDRYAVMPVRISRDGIWHGAKDLPEPRTAEATVDWLRSGFPTGVDTTPIDSVLAMVDRLQSCDVVFPVLHGPFGEDGTVQSLLDGLGIPFVGNGVAASALSMDKEYTKKIAASAGIAVADGVVLRRGRDDVAAAERDRLGLPVFVKPSREGSSIGVSKVDDWTELPAALERARASDEKVLVEAAVDGREIHVGVLERPGGHLEVSPPLEILTSAEHIFNDYQAKYADPSTVLDTPARLDPDVTERLGREAIRVFRALDCTGLLRADFFVRSDGSTVLNEVNTFPGFTSASSYPQAWQAVGIGYGELLDILIDTAMWRAGARIRDRVLAR